MKFKKPKFWDYKKPGFLSYILLPATLPVYLNNWFFKKIYPIKIVGLKQFVLEIYTLVEQEKRHYL